MKKQFSVFLLLLSFVSDVSSQTQEARKIDEFGYIPCGEFMARADVAYQELKELTDAKFYVIYYEGKNYVANVLNKKLKTYESKVQNPRRGDALNKAKELELYFRSERGFTDKVFLIDGGYRGDLTLELWIVPQNAAEPKPTPTVEEKDVTFSKGKPYRTRDCARAYDGL